ncbi:MAG TPA: choice-of-anchor tandem repeat GloVer-containing protein [Candidatus Baltobacteraceae bacterium]|jgi:uncharacterized repeat protein (TIGR03803 family)|nr:choice-of-anchor tandem repeat GloVer-containing protein [Candidatus Baltobacteraceae bacterium]
MLWAAALVLPALVTQADVVFTCLYSFSGGNDGANPVAALVQGSDGNFYGTAEYGGAYTNQFGIGYGTVFKISATGALTTLYAFGTLTNADGGPLDGAHPSAGLIQASDAYFYGTTGWGGTNGLYPFGTVFKITSNGALTTLHSFNGTDDGANRAAALAQGSDGNFYGTTSGAAFQMTPAGVLTTLASLAWPSALVQGNDGYFYGTTYGTIDIDNINSFFPTFGTVFKISANGALTTLYAFGTITNANGVPLDGANPIAGLVQGSDGNFYGTTKAGGDDSAYAYDGLGAVFEITTNGALKTLHSFTGNDGANPVAALVQSSDGNFYGTTSGGQFFGNGTVFKISTSGTLTTLYHFGSITNASGEALDGANPCAALVQGSDGNFYGTTSEGGTYGNGTVFRLTLVPEFQAVTLTKTTLNLTWSTEAGSRYQLQYTSDLSSSNWTNLNGPITATVATLNTTDSVTNAPQRFYRLVLVP